MDFVLLFRRICGIAPKFYGLRQTRLKPGFLEQKSAATAALKSDGSTAQDSQSGTSSANNADRMLDMLEVVMTPHSGSAARLRGRSGRFSKQLLQWYSASDRLGGNDLPAPLEVHGIALFQDSSPHDGVAPAGAADSAGGAATGTATDSSRPGRSAENRSVNSNSASSRSVPMNGESHGGPAASSPALSKSAGHAGSARSRTGTGSSCGDGAPSTSGSGAPSTPPRVPQTHGSAESPFEAQSPQRHPG